jgi:zinc transport system substrate-binding protein
VAAAEPMRVRVTLHPYYSWTANVVKDTGSRCVSVLPGEVDAGDYQPRPEDIAKIARLDAIVVNGVGHDDFINDMIKASGNAKLQVIRPNDGDPALKAVHGGTVNSHTFISFTNASADLRDRHGARAHAPEHASKLQANAAEYAGRLRALKSKAARAAGGRQGEARRHRARRLRLLSCRSSASRSRAWSSPRTASCLGEGAGRHGRAL